MDDTSNYYIKAHKGAKLYLDLGSNVSASGLAIHDLLPVFCVFWTNFGQMTLTFQVGRSRSFERFITNCPKVYYFDITRFGPSIHRITTKIMT